MKRLLALVLMLIAAPAMAQMQFPIGPSGAAAVNGQPITPSTVTASDVVSGTGEIRVTGNSGTARYVKFQTSGVDASYIALGGDNVTQFFSAPTGGGYNFQVAPSGSVETITATGVLVSGGLGASGGITTSGATNGIGYAVGAGGAVAQATSRTTGVTLNKMCGAITLFSTTTSAGQVTTFTVTDSGVGATDVIIIDQKTGTGIYIPTITAIGAGTFNVSVYTPAAVGSAEAPVMQFCAFKGVNS